MNKHGINIEIDIEMLQKTGLFVGIPMYGGLCYGPTTASLIHLAQMCTAHRIKFVPYFLYNESLIQRARNYIVDMFLAQDEVSTMIFIDADVNFNPKDVFAMMQLQNDNQEYEILCGAYPKKAISYEKIATAVNKGVADKNPGILENYVGDFVFNPIRESVKKRHSIFEPLEVYTSGTGFMMFNKQTLLKIKEAYPQYFYTPDHRRSKDFDGSRKIQAFFHCDIDEESNRYLSEDYWFCKKARDIGIKTFICPWINLDHTGTYTFKGNMQAIASIGETFFS